MSTAYITHADCLKHEMGAGHPECPDRLVAVNEHMRSSVVLEQLRVLDAPLAQPADLTRVHRPEYVHQIFDIAPSEKYMELYRHWLINPNFLSAARRAAGAG